MTQSIREFRAELLGYDAAGVLQTYKYATTGHFDSGNYVDGRLSMAGVFQRRMFDGDRLRGVLSVGTSALTISNVDGALDSLRTIGFTNNPVFLHELDPSTLAPLFPNSYTTLVTDQPVVDEDKVIFSLRGPFHIFDREFTTVRYAGTNTGSPEAGIEGLRDLEGRVKPFAGGRVYNISPVLVNQAKLIYQVNGVTTSSTAPGGQDAAAAGAGFSSTLSELQVFDSGVPLVQGADYINLADMEANAPSPGQYRRSPHTGCFRLGSKPIGRVTCNFCPYTNVVQLGGTNGVVALLMKTIWKTTGLPLNGVYGSYLVNNPEVGIYIAEERRGVDVLAEMMGSVNGTLVWGQAPVSATPSDERPLLMQLSTPANSQLWLLGAFTPLVLNESDLITQITSVIPGEDHRGMPVWKVRLGYKRNYTVMTEEEIAGSVSDADVQFLTTEYRYVTVSDSSVKTQWPHATELQINTCLNLRANAVAEANRLLGMFKVKRDMFAFSITGDSIRLQSANPRRFCPGWVVRLTHSRFGMSGSKDFILLSMTEDYDNDKVDLVVWG